MNTGSTEPTTTWREGRRLRAWELAQQGWSQRRIAEALGVSKGAVSQWLTRARQSGSSALRDRRPPGRTPLLPPEQQAALPGLLRQGAPAFGFQGDLWTRKRVREVLRRTFGVVYSLSHIGRLLRRLNWTRQKPVRRARQRDPAAIQEWREQRYPTLAKGGRA